MVFDRKYLIPVFLAAGIGGSNAADQTLESQVSVPLTQPQQTDHQEIDSAEETPVFACNMDDAATLNRRERMNRMLESTVIINIDKDFEEVGVGSGLVIDREQGLIVTNTHVILSYLYDPDQTMQVGFYDSDRPNNLGATTSAEIIGHDKISDLTVLKIDPSHTRACTVLADEKPVQGNDVIAIGHGFNLTYSVTSGVISNINRFIAKGNYPLYQVNADIGPGNSGGPSFDKETGESIGINQSVFSNILMAKQGPRPVGLVQSPTYHIGFTIPSMHTKKIAEELIENGEVKRHVIGLEYSKPDKKLLGEAGYDSGVTVKEISPWSYARNSDLKENDIIVGVDGEPVYNHTNYLGKVFNSFDKNNISLSVLRDGQTLEVNVPTEKEKDFEKRKALGDGLVRTYNDALRHVSRSGFGKFLSGYGVKLRDYRLSL